jgi:hypothetical protein
LRFLGFALKNRYAHQFPINHSPFACVSIPAHDSTH